MIEALYRSTDPVESEQAATRVSQKVTADRLLTLAAFDYIGAGTYREAARWAQRSEGSTGTERLESLRRRGSDLKALGWIRQEGRYDGQANFVVTDAGRAALAAARGA